MNRTPYLQGDEYIGYPVGEAPAPAAEPEKAAKKPPVKKAAAKPRAKKPAARK